MAHVRSILAKVLAGRSTLRSAALALGMTRDALPEGLDGRRLAIWRAYMADEVRMASPLVIRVCDLNGYDLDDLATKLGPGMYWDQWLCGVRPHDVWLRSVAGGVAVQAAPQAEREGWALREWLHGGLKVYGEDRGLLFGIRVLDGGLETAVSVGGHRLRTHGLEGSITLGMRLPDTVMAALPGVALDRFIDHPLINHAGCVVTGVDEFSVRWGTKVRFALDPVPWRMPWARGPDTGPAVVPAGSTSTSIA